MKPHHHRCGVPDCPVDIRSITCPSPAIVGCVQSGLQVLTKSFCEVEAFEDEEGNMLVDQNGEPKMKVPNSRVELPYTYWTAWYVMHCPSLVTAMQASKGFIPFMQKLERSNWQDTYMFFIRRIIQSVVNYQLVRCFPEIQDAFYGECFLDFAGSDDFTTLSSGVFYWLINIRLGYLIFRQGDAYTIESYTPSRFAR